MLAARTIAAIYQERSQIELFFKAPKQPLKVAWSPRKPDPPCGSIA
jgi:IS4 transposase